MAARKKAKSDEPDLIIKPIPRAVRPAFSGRKTENTPDGAMLNALHDAYDVDVGDSSSYRKFVTALMQSLSRLVTGGRSDRMFEPDFESFIVMVVRSINSCGEMMSLLEQNGIEYRPKWKKDDEYGDDYEDDEEEEQ